MLAKTVLKREWGLGTGDWGIVIDYSPRPCVSLIPLISTKRNAILHAWRVFIREDVSDADYRRDTLVNWRTDTNFGLVGKPF